MGRQPDLPHEVVARHALSFTGDPDGRPVVLLHGFGCDQTIWDGVRPGLDDHAVYSYDHAGTGRSDPAAYEPARYAALDGYVDDLLTLVRRLDLHDVALVGHSVGAATALLASLADPERFSALVLIGASPWYVDEPGYIGGFTRSDIDDLLATMEANYLGWSHTMAPVIAGTPDRPEVSDAFRGHLLAARPDVAARFARVAFLTDLRGDLADVTVPALVLQATDDAIVPQATAEWLQAHLRASELRVLAATGHLPHLSDPAETLAAVRSFLSRTGGGS